MKGLLAAAFVLFTCNLLAQENYFYFNWDINKPVSNTEWINKTSAAGFQAGYRVFINPKFSAGVDVSTVTYDQYKPTETTFNGNGATTTDLFKYIYSYSAVVSGQYNFTVGNGERFFPYVGLGAGANYNNYVVYYNIYQNTEAAWGFLARPEAGMLVRLGRTFGLMGAVHYDYSTNKSVKFDYSGFSSAGVRIGIVFIQL
jgi:hypothetical protein